MSDLSTVANAIGMFQVLLVLVGLILAGAWFFAPRLQAARRQPARLPRWNAPLGDTMLLGWVALVAVMVGSLLAGSLFRRFGLSVSDGWTSILTVLGFQGALTVAVTAFSIYKRSVGLALPAVGIHPAIPLGDRLLLGAAIFCAAMPLIYATSFASGAALEALGLPVKQQDLAGLFASTDSPLLLLALTFMAVVVVPLGEELLFRAGLFRMLGRFLPRWPAILGSALLFATLHWSAVHFVPLTVLGVCFALAYEKTGSLLVPVVAHGLFNLNSILGLLAGLGAAP